MAVRVTEAEVEEIIDIDSSLSTTAFITAANALVTAVCVDSSLTTTLLKEIERWVSAHFIAMSKDPRAVKEKAGPISTDFGFKQEIGLKNTTYGQTAINLDISGALGQLAKGTTKAIFKTLNPIVE